MVHTFNTGRAYTDQGQIIHAEISDGRCWFHDISRGIAGSFECLAIDLSPYTIESLVITSYDFGNYRTERSPSVFQARHREDDSSEALP